MSIGADEVNAHACACVAEALCALLCRSRLQSEARSLLARTPPSRSAMAVTSKPAGQTWAQHMWRCRINQEGCAGYGGPVCKSCAARLEPIRGGALRVESAKLEYNAEAMVLPDKKVDLYQLFCSTDGCWGSVRNKDRKAGRYICSARIGSGMCPHEAEAMVKAQERADPRDPPSGVGPPTPPPPPANQVQAIAVRHALRRLKDRAVSMETRATQRTQDSTRQQI